MLSRAALLVVDVQRDFCPGGALPVPKGDLVVPVLNRYLQLFARRGCPIFASRDWHPRDSTHFQEFGGGWPAHCVQESEGAKFHPELLLPEETIVVSKGITRWDEGYSALQGVTADGVTCSELLRKKGVIRLYVGGLATDYCVKASVLEALKEGWQATLLSDAIHGVDLKPGDAERAVAEMVEAGAELATLESIGGSLITESA
ncbi:isochorismatase family protein [Geomonas sp.]|uniref:isochorismatase family protein n=1 Tax=Geomonas sp. TaxID=2651584 RepID=UPI002B4A2458|nr:isochorismatase family protein [Geomonas sp.]HJV35962.1 isochorismatase family protein [Geomonas sp.]